MLALAGILVTLGVCWLVLSPLFLRIGAPLADGPDRLAELRELETLRDVAYETLRDIEFDFHAGKISEADYRELTDRYKAEALHLVRRLDALRSTAPAPSERPRDTP
jgi:hypothetical protein